MTLGDVGVAIGVLIAVGVLLAVAWTVRRTS
jgi:hypothetical protein